MKALNSLFLVSCILFLASPAFAARPLVTDDCSPVAAGRYELEFGFATAQLPAGEADGLDLSFRRGISDKLDFGIEVPYMTSAPSGLSDLLLHAKYRLWPVSAEEGLTGRIDYKFNNGDASQGLGSGDNDYCLMLIYSRLFGSAKTHLNFGYVRVGINSGVTSRDYFAYTAAVEYPAWGEKGDLVAEYVANNAGSPGPAFIQLGARWSVSPGLKLDVGCAVGLNSNTIKNCLTGGIHAEF